jgi:predicted Zn-dependent protease
MVCDAQSESLLHKFADPLFRAAILDPGMVRVILVRDGAITGFVSTGNRMLVLPGPPELPWRLHQSGNRTKQSR